MVYKKNDLEKRMFGDWCRRHMNLALHDGGNSGYFDKNLVRHPNLNLLFFSGSDRNYLFFKLFHQHNSNKPNHNTFSLNRHSIKTHGDALCSDLCALCAFKCRPESVGRACGLLCGQRLWAQPVLQRPWFMREQRRDLLRRRWVPRASDLRYDILCLHRSHAGSDDAISDGRSWMLLWWFVQSKW